MKIATTLLLLALAGLAAGQEVEREPRARGVPMPALTAGADTPWLGVLRVGPLNDAIRAQVPDLPKGIGFMVLALDADGPSEKAGVKPYDLVWKLGDQLIANQAQFVTLLQLHKEGEEVKLSVFRSGKALEIPVVLGHIPEKLPVDPSVLVPPAAKGGAQDVPMKVYRKDPASLETETPEGKAVLTRKGNDPEVKIVSNSGSLIYEGPVYDENGVSRVPEAWQICVGALERGLTHVVNEKALSRPPRPRTNVSPAEDAAK